MKIKVMGIDESSIWDLEFANCVEEGFLPFKETSTKFLFYDINVDLTNTMTDINIIISP